MYRVLDARSGIVVFLQNWVKPGIEFLSDYILYKKTDSFKFYLGITIVAFVENFS